MDLTQQKPGDHFYIHSVSDQGIRIVDQIFNTAVIVSAQHLKPDWPVNNAREIGAHHVDAIIELNPEVVLIGTGRSQIFLPPELLMLFYQRSIGVEVMNTQAACRTFNVLVSEYRNVVAALLPPKN